MKWFLPLAALLTLCLGSARACPPVVNLSTGYAVSGFNVNVDPYACGNSANFFFQQSVGYGVPNATFALNNGVLVERRGFFGRRVDVFTPGVDVRVGRFGRVRVRDNLGTTEIDRKKVKIIRRPKRLD